MKTIIDVCTGEVKVASGKSILRSSPIASCIAVTAWDRIVRVGAMAHIMLPGKAPGSPKEPDRYARNAMTKMLLLLEETGAKRQQLDVCATGGANVLQREDDTICAANCASIEQIFRDEGLNIRRIAFGGFNRRSLILDVHTGQVRYTEGASSDKVFWEP